MVERHNHPDDREPMPLWLKAVVVTLVIGIVVGWFGMLGVYCIVSELSRPD